MHGAFEATDWALRADRFIERSSRRVVRAWERRIRELRFEVALPPIEEIPLRPLFVTKTFVADVLAASCEGVRAGPIAMPSAIGGPERFVVSEPPHGREWILHAAYLDVMRAPWLGLVGIDAPSTFDPLAAWFRSVSPGGTLAIALSASDWAAVEETSVRLMQLAWWIEAQLARHGVSARVVEGSSLRERGTRLPDGTAIAAVAWWSAPAAEVGCPQWPWPLVDRRAVPSMVKRPGSRYAALEADADHRVFKPYADAWAAMNSVDPPPAADEGFWQSRPEPPVVRLPFVKAGVVRWEDCHVELGVLGLEGTVVAAFGACGRVTDEGLVDLICPAVVVP